ncbi:hypothetical protein GCM10011519_17240 [Marmoricola endophyticus]|uniref:DUF559 domain-containing protein n=1 Tax=Marmoricola endophyticus TaxID=2040280 RepID=A0A917F348_9ACTN|nr:hypothetical protein [Marmoricola endophyticus]GGF43969.1 hypothetical protein GCM10011519_17240 [Marmoricola endophyticus]
MERVVGPFSESVVAPVRVGSRHRAGPMASEVRGPSWRRSSRGWYVPTSAPLTAEQRIVEAAAVLRPGTAVTGWAALRWMGGRWFSGASQGGRVLDDVDLVAMCREIRTPPGARVSQERLTPADVVGHDGLPVTVAARSACFLMRYAPSLTAAVVAAEMAAFSDLVSADELAAYVLDHPGWTGIERARRATRLMSENSWSPMESRLRMLWLKHGLPAVLVNPPVFDLAGRHVATPDLLEPESGLAVEYDGVEHLDVSQRRHDVGREEQMRDVGLEYVTVLGPDLAAPERLAARMERAVRRAASTRRVRSWTTTPPPGWLGADTVAERRALRARHAA